MKLINKETQPKKTDVTQFLDSVSFKLPKGFIEFFSTSNGGVISNEDEYVALWPLNEMIELNSEYETDEYADKFFFSDQMVVVLLIVWINHGLHLHHAFYKNVK